MAQTLKISAYIASLTAAKEAFGDLPILGGEILDDTRPGRVLALDKDDCETQRRDKAVGFYLSAQS